MKYLIVLMLFSTVCWSQERPRLTDEQYNNMWYEMWNYEVKNIHRRTNPNGALSANYYNEDIYFLPGLKFGPTWRTLTYQSRLAWYNYFLPYMDFRGIIETESKNAVINEENRQAAVAANPM